MQSKKMVNTGNQKLWRIFARAARATERTRHEARVATNGSLLTCNRVVSFAINRTIADMAATATKATSWRALSDHVAELKSVVATACVAAMVCRGSKEQRV
ncbi:unnamed protein product [Prorocentrum cordatum]|uniref:Uncharacterized protein n=1 Tax=Prorocentrum cordatum TaxID=2364126 RepID=A0ABN9QL84_9DINO|nr:unnamed protein product [Polarella glacialis]